MINFRLIRHLWLFLAVAEERHFGRAARRLGMSQPPLTEQIRVLEQALKVQLFDRSRRGTQLTPAGQALLPEVRKLAEHLERIELAVREAVRGQQGVLTIGAVSAVMLDLLPELIAKLKERHPQVTVSVREIDSGEAAAALRDGDVDLALVRLDDPPASGLAAAPLRAERLAVALPPGHALAERSRLRLRDLAAEDFVFCFRRASPNYFDTLIEACRTAGFSPRIVHEVGSVASQLAFVACGQGVALVPASLKRMAAGGVLLRTLTGPTPAVTVSAVWNAARAHPLVPEAVALATASTH